MKTFDLFVVEINKRINDTMKTESGLELYIDNRFNEFQNRTTEAPVVAVPFKYDTGVEVGDTLYFHHLVVVNDGQPLTGEDNHYLVRFDPDNTVTTRLLLTSLQRLGTYIRWRAGHFSNEWKKEKRNSLILSTLLNSKTALSRKGRSLLLRLGWKS